MKIQIEGHLNCKCCGYKQYDEDTIFAMKQKFPSEETYDIPYFCCACLDNATDEEYEVMMKEMKN